MKKVVALAMLLIVPLHASAQTHGTIPDAISAGATLGLAHSGQSRSGGGPGPQFAGNVELPLSEGRLRVSVGHMHWTPSNGALSSSTEAGQVGLSRITTTAIWPQLQPSVRYPFGLYAGIGVGVYRYHIAHGPASHRTARGLHVLAGAEFLSSDQRRVLRLEFEMNAVGGPGHQQVWAYTMFGVSASAGISRRF